MLLVVCVFGWLVVYRRRPRFGLGPTTPMTSIRLCVKSWRLRMYIEHFVNILSFLVCVQLSFASNWSMHVIITLIHKQSLKVTE